MSGPIKIPEFTDEQWAHLQAEVKRAEAALRQVDVQDEAAWRAAVERVVLMRKVAEYAHVYDDLAEIYIGSLVKGAWWYQV